MTVSIADAIVDVDPDDDDDIDDDPVTPTSNNIQHTLTVDADIPKATPAPIPISDSAALPQPPASNDLPRDDTPDPSASVHSLPVVQITAPTSPTTTRRPTTAYVPQPADRDRLSDLPPASPSSRSAMSTNSSLTSQERSRRPRSALDVRHSNRLSGFFSNLMHRRDNIPSNTARPANREENRTAPPPARETPPPAGRSRSPSPTPPPRPSTPPPALQSPNLHELGLSLSVITSDLSPSHFATPPISGTFLAPHYLLLCHSQGLDVLPLTAPPAPQPYALVRRVPFKSVVVMEQRGVLVAIAGRRDGVRVYALEEVKKVVEWRMDVEVRREKERMRRDEAKKGSNSLDYPGSTGHDDERKKGRLSPIPGKPTVSRSKSLRKSPSASSTIASSVVAAPIPRTPTIRRPKPPSSVPPTIPVPPVPPLPPADAVDEQVIGRPPPYSSSEAAPMRQTHSTSPATVVEIRPDTLRRVPSVVDVLSGSPGLRRNTEPVLPSTQLNTAHHRQEDTKADDWLESRASDEEAIDIVAAGPSGSQALDERTSANASQTAAVAAGSPTFVRAETSPITARPRASSTRRSRPANLELSIVTTVPPGGSAPSPSQPSPTPTLQTLRQTLLQQSPPNASAGVASPEAPPVSAREPDEDDEDVDMEAADRQSVVGEQSGEQVTLVQALLESRLPNLPPMGTRRAQQPILITASHAVAGADEDVPASPRSSDVHEGSLAHSRSLSGGHSISRRRRRRWSVNLFSVSATSVLQQTGDAHLQPSQTPSGVAATSTTPTSPTRSAGEQHQAPRQSSQSSRPRVATNALVRPSTSPTSGSRSNTLDSRDATSPTPTSMSTTAPSHTRLLSRLLNSAFGSRRSEDHDSVLVLKHQDVEGTKGGGSSTAGQTAPPKLEYVKLPGTKGALLVKAVETAKKSFLAILCGENGEKVELFAGTYRTALGLSRTFILPDSPRSLELQLQGDDLVEVFLVFSQNVFGLEPATVRVREIRIGRAERRAARRRARELRAEEMVLTGQEPEHEAEHEPAAALGGADDDTNVDVSINVAVSGTSDMLAPGQGPHPAELASSGSGAGGHPTPTAPSAEGSPAPGGDNVTELTGAGSGLTAAAHAEELSALASVHSGPYTTFQQLSFAPHFPLAAIADDYIIPPTYASFLDYRAQYEPPEAEGHGAVDLAQVQFSPPGLPVPILLPPSKWFYRDPKGVVHGPWKASLMQAWYKDGLLPPDLPVRREEDAEYMLLKELRLQSVDPTHPFRSPPPPLQVEALSILQENAKPLLTPISLLAQPRHFGPPALFFSSRGGHSTAIVDARGKSVLKGRFVWSVDEGSEDKGSRKGRTGKLGDVKRLEAFDVKDRAVLVAMRQGGLEAVDLGDALLRPGDESRTVLPHFGPPMSNINRRGPWIWRIGTPISSSSQTSNTDTTAALAVKTTKSHTITKKLTPHTGKSPSRAEFAPGGDLDSDNRDEILFLGRREDEIFLCERIAGSFRLLRLCPS